MNELDRDRDSLIDDFFDDGEYWGGIKRFQGMDHVALQKLVDEKYADPDDAQNSAPTLGSFLEMMKLHPALLAHGYVVSHDRGDSRVSIEGLHCDLAGIELQLFFKERFKDADDLRIDEGSVYCWYD